MRLARRGVIAALLGAFALPSASWAQKAEPTTFVVFFNFKHARLSRSARQALAKAAETIKAESAAGRLSHVKAIGYADTVGSAGGAQKLSQARADAVRAELARLGVTADKITTEARGKTELAVPTADQVREPRNRRVRIVLYRPGD